MGKGANLEALDDWEESPVIAAAGKGHLDVVVLLRDKGANIGFVSGIKGVTALMCASFNAQPHVCSAHILWGMDWLQTQKSTDKNRSKPDSAKSGFVRALGRKRDSQKLRTAKARLDEEWRRWPHPPQVARRNWERRRSAMLFLAGSGLRPLLRNAPPVPAVTDTHSPLPPIPRRTKGENRTFLLKTSLVTTTLSGGSCLTYE